MSQNNITTKHIKIKDLKQRESIETMVKVNTPIKTIAKWMGYTLVDTKDKEICYTKEK